MRQAARDPVPAFGTLAQLRLLGFVQDGIGEVCIGYGRILEAALHEQAVLKHRTLQVRPVEAAGEGHHVGEVGTTQIGTNQA